MSGRRRAEQEAYDDLGATDEPSTTPVVQDTRSGGAWHPRQQTVFTPPGKDLKATDKTKVKGAVKRLCDLEEGQGDQRVAS